MEQVSPLGDRHILWMHHTFLCSHTLAEQKEQCEEKKQQQQKVPSTTLFRSLQMTLFMWQERKIDRERERNGKRI